MIIFILFGLILKYWKFHPLKHIEHSINTIKNYFSGEFWECLFAFGKKCIFFLKFGFHFSFKFNAKVTWKLYRICIRILQGCAQICIPLASLLLIELVLIKILLNTLKELYLGKMFYHLKNK